LFPQGAVYIESEGCIMPEAPGGHQTWRDWIPEVGIPCALVYTVSSSGDSTLRTQPLRIKSMMLL